MNVKENIKQKLVDYEYWPINWKDEKWNKTYLDETNFTNLFYILQFNFWWFGLTCVYDDPKYDGGQAESLVDARRGRGVFRHARSLHRDHHESDLQDHGCSDQETE